MGGQQAAEIEGARARMGPAGLGRESGDVFTSRPTCVHRPARIRPDVFTFPANVFTFRTEVFSVTRRDAGPADVSGTHWAGATTRPEASV